jgi:hypothetical protein
MIATTSCGIAGGRPMLLVPYFFLKIVFFFGIVRSLVKYDTLSKHFLFLGILYTAGVALLSFVFIVGWENMPYRLWQLRISARLGVSPWVAWLFETFLLSTLYFKLLGRFDEGGAFWILLLLGIPIVFF